MLIKYAFFTLHKIINQLSSIEWPRKGYSLKLKSRHYELKWTVITRQCYFWSCIPSSQIRFEKEVHACRIRSIISHAIAIVVLMNSCMQFQRTKYATKGLVLFQNSLHDARWCLNIWRNKCMAEIWTYKYQFHKICEIPARSHTWFALEFTILIETISGT